MLRQLVIALRFLTCIPIPLSGAANKRDVGYSLLYYPAIGLIIGLLLAGLYWVTSGADDRLTAAFLLVTWVMITGGIHLDGLADSADAWLGGIGDRQRTLAIMKDPHCGTAAIVTLIVVLILKFAALEVIVAKADWNALLLAPVLARTTPLVLFLTTPYVRSNGLGTALAEHPPHGVAVWATVAVIIAALFALDKQAMWLLLTVGVSFALLRALMMRRIGGTTGDTAGATVELIETTALVTAAIA